MSFEQLIKQRQERVNTVLDKILISDGNVPSQLLNAMRYSALDAGKRLRPLLVYECGDVFGADINDLDFAAAAVECIHVYSLIHDDLPAMDDDDLRRGKPTCHIAFDEATAILAGDALQTLAFETILDSSLSNKAELMRLEMIRNLAHASGAKGMGGGQMKDLLATNKVLKIEQLIQMHQMKTGALIQSSVLLGIQCAGIKDEHIIKNMAEFGSLIGLAFQVKDDILDIEADTAVLGKPSGSDLALNKSTFPSLMGLDAAKNYATDLIKQSLQALDTIQYNTDQLEKLALYIIERKY